MSDSAKKYTIAVIPGDGIGKEVTPWAQKALEKAAEGVAEFEYEKFDLGAERYLRDGAILPEEEEERIKKTDAMRAVAENLHIATDDGSEGFKGLVTALIGELIEKEGRHYDECVAIGPMIMMKFVALTTKKYALKTTVSLNALMVDGTGMCGACRVTVGGRTRFTCVDGPEFDAHEVDFDEAMRRQGMYRNQEQRAAAIEAEREAGHVCKIGLDK